MFRNAVPPHLVEKPCRLGCGKKVKALDAKTGQLQMHPICDECRSELERAHHLASLAVQRQARKRMMSKGGRR